MSVTEIKTEGYGSRLANSVKGALIGGVLFLLSFVVLWWNEGDIVREKDAINEMNKSVVVASVEKPDAQNDSKLVHLTGTLASSETLGDGQFVKPGSWLKLARDVEMYQWVEEKETESKSNVGGSKTTKTTYTYKMDWADGRVNSANFKQPEGHENPQLTVENGEYAVKSATFGGYDGVGVIEHLDANKPVALTQGQLMGGELQSGKVYLRRTPGTKEPMLGDVRITYKGLEGGTFSVMATQTGGNKLTAYHASNGKEKFLVETGARDVKAMIQSATDSAKAFAMFMRFIGFIMMWIGLAMALGPFSTLLDVIPFLGSLGRFAAGAVAFAAAAALSTVTIVVAMIAHNPIALAVVVVAAAGGGFFFLKKRREAKAAQPQQPGQAITPESQQAGKKVA